MKNPLVLKEPFLSICAYLGVLLALVWLTVPLEYLLKDCPDAPVAVGAVYDYRQGYADGAVQVAHFDSWCLTGDPTPEQIDSVSRLIADKCNINKTPCTDSIAALNAALEWQRIAMMDMTGRTSVDYRLEIDSLKQHIKEGAGDGR